VTARAQALRAQANALEAQAAALRLEAEALDAEVAPATGTAVYMRVVDYARRVSMGERTIWALVARGLPSVGSGRGRRVDVAGADVWMREQGGQVDGAVEWAARTSARSAARRAAVR